MFEIVSFDSRQVYKVLEVGTAKPDSVIRGKINHHLIDYLEPSERINAAKNAALAKIAVNEIFERGKIPVLTAGTGFYLRAFLYGMFDVVEVSEEVKSYYKSLTREERWKLLSEKDREAIEKVSYNDDYRISRALEILHTGLKWSSLKENRDDGFLSTANLEVTGIFIEWERNELYSRINDRCKVISSSGLFEETKEVVSKYGEDAPALNSLGYNFALDYIRGLHNLDTFYELFARSHRNYAKKQITWFKKDSLLKKYDWQTALRLLKNIEKR